MEGKCSGRLGGQAGDEAAETKGPPSGDGGAAVGVAADRPAGRPAGERTTRARHDVLRGRMDEDEFDVRVLDFAASFGGRMEVVGAKGWSALDFALGTTGDPYDEDAVKLALSAPGLDVNVSR